MTKQPCPACDRPTLDGLLCTACVRRLRNDLDSLPELLAQLDVTMSRQSVTGSGAGKRSDDPLPLDLDAADQYWAIRNTLLTWVRELDLGDLNETAPSWVGHQDGPPERGRRIVKRLVNDPAAWCAWLAQRIERIRGHAEAAQLVDEIDYCARAAMAAIDLPGDGEYCGTCDICGKHLYAGRDAAEVTCRYCQWAGIDAVYPVAGRRQDLASKAEGIAVLTKAQILELAPSYRVTISSSTFSTWVSRGQLVEADQRHGVPRYLLGDALRLARGRKRIRGRHAVRRPA